MTKKKQTSETNWMAVLLDFQLLVITLVFINGMTIMNDSGFTWLGLGVSLSTLAFVLMSLYLRNTRFSK